MTWKQFKELLEKKGLKDDDAIWYIDVSYPSIGDDVQVKINERDGASVYN